MRLGVAEALGDRLVREGHRLRIYVPFGEHWYAYSLRRLQENPKIAGYIAADTLGRFVRRRKGSGGAGPRLGAVGSSTPTAGNASTFPAASGLPRWGPVIRGSPTPGAR